MPVNSPFESQCHQRPCFQENLPPLLPLPPPPPPGVQHGTEREVVSRTKDNLGIGYVI